MRSPSNMTLRAALLARVALYSVDLFTVNLRNGTTYHWCSGDQDITHDLITYSASGPALERSSWGAKNTTEVPELQIKLLSNGADISAGNIKSLLHEGLFDGAYIQLDRSFQPQYGDTSLGVITLFGGRVGKIEITALGATITCIASNVLLQQNVPRNTYQLSCIHSLYDSGCTLSRAAHTTPYAIVVSGLTAIELVSPPADLSIYLGGVIEVLDGAGVGQRRSVQAWIGAVVGIAYPWFIPPAPGDSVALTEGCDKSIARCTAFANAVNFRGFPYIPPAGTGF